MIENHPLSEQQGQPGDPQIARVHDVRFPEFAPKRQGQATAQVPQRRGAKRCTSPDSRHSRKLGCRRAVGLVGSGNVQPRPGTISGQVFGRRYEDLGIRLRIGKWIFEGEQDLQGV